VKKKVSLIVCLMLISLLNAQQANVEILPSKVVDRDIIQNQLLEYRVKTDSILLRDYKNPNAYRVSAFIDIIQFRFSKVKEKLEKAILLDSIAKNKIGLSEDYNILGRFYKDTQNNDSAYFFYKKASLLSKKNDPRLAGRHLENLFAIYSIRYQTDSAMVVIKEALEFSSRANDSVNILLLKKREKNLLTKGKSNLKTAIDISDYGKKIGNDYLIAFAQGDIGKHFQNKKDSLTFAAKYLDSSIVFFEKTKNLFFLNTVYPSRAYVSLKDTVSDKSPLDYYKIQYETVKNTGHIFEEVTLFNIANEYIKIGKTSEAKAIYESIVELSKEKEIQKLLLAMTHENLSAIYEDQKRYRDALIEYKKLYKNEIDAYSTTIADQANKYKIEFETEKKEKENLQLKADNAEQELLTEKANTRNWLLVAGLLVLGLSAFFIWRRYKSETKAKQRISEQKEMIESLQRELHHRVKNNLLIIDTFIVFAKKGMDDSVIREKLTELQNRIDSINFVHEQLYKADDVTQLNIKEYVHKLTQSIQDSFNNEKIKVEEKIDSGIYLNSNKAFSLGIIVNEFFNNSFKHAFNNIDDGLITISLKEERNNYMINLSDNGVGLPSNLDIDDLDSFGLDIMKISTKQLEGSFSMTSNNGATLAITFPK